MRRMVAMRSGWVLSTIKLSVSSPWQRAQRATREGSGDALETRRAGYWRPGGFACARRCAGSPPGSIDNGHAESPGAMTLHTVLREESRAPAAAVAWPRRACWPHPGAELANRCCSSRTCVISGDGEDEVDEHHQHDNDAESGKPRRSFHRRFRLLLPRRAMRSLAERQEPACWRSPCHASWVQNLEEDAGVNAMAHGHTPAGALWCDLPLAPSPDILSRTVCPRHTVTMHS